jgi:hypothetical protein
MQFLRLLDKLYSIRDHLLVSLAASMIAHLLHATMIFLGTDIEFKSHNLVVSVELKVRT